MANPKISNLHQVLTGKVSSVAVCSNDEPVAELVFSAKGVVKFENEKNGDFYAMTEHVLEEIVKETQEKVDRAPSFFDEMDNFSASRTISRAEIDKLTERLEYSSGDFRSSLEDL